MNDVALPPGACDCHVHMFEPQWPLAPTALSVPPVAPASAYREVQQSLGLSRVVVVQPTAYGFDNRCTLDAMAQWGDSARGVAVVDAQASDAQLQALHEAGIRGVRFQMLPGGALPWEALEPVAERIRPFGWHIDLQMDGAGFPDVAERLSRLTVPLVIDHNGKFLRPPAVDAPEVTALRRLLDGGRCWIKLSAPYETSRDGAPHYADVSALARCFAREHTERCLWASNWPHLNQQPMPDDRALLALLHDWSPNQRAMHQILVGNPQRCYGF
jgi:D-galactarolactone isomerase